MMSGMFRLFITTVILGLTLVTGTSNAAPPTDCRRTINIRADQAAPLSFGDLLVSGSGLVVIGTNNSRYSNGGVVPANGTVSAAHLIVSGCKDSPYTIVLQPSTTISTATDSMLVDTFVYDPIVGLLSSSGKQDLFIGATLHVGDGQTAGAYTGSFVVEVVYQ